MTAPPSDDDMAAALGLTLALAQREAPLTYGASDTPWCSLCEADAPGGATTMPESAHAPTCEWRQARELERRMLAR